MSSSQSIEKGASRRALAGFLLCSFLLCFSSIGSAALEPSGEVDTTFNSPFGFNTTNFSLVNTFAEARGVGIQHVGANSGKMVVGGSYQDGINSHFALLRVNSDGTQDFGFGLGGEIKTAVGGNDLINDIAIQSDDKIVAAGFVDNNIAVVRYLPDGAIDTSFGGGDGIVIAALVAGQFNRGYSVAIQPADGKILVGASSFTTAGNGRDLAVLRLNTDGSVDTGFGGGDGFATVSLSTTGTERAFGIAVQSDGKIVAVGNSPTGTSSCNTFAYTDQNSVVVRFNSNGAIDAGFGVSGIVTLSLGVGNCPDDEFRGVTIQPDGKIVATGDAVTTHDGSTNPKLNISVARLNTDGTKDNSFDADGLVFTNIAPTSTFLSDIGEMVRVQTDGGIVVGAFTSADVGGGLTAANFAVLRYTTAGALDSTFDSDGIKVIDFGDDDNLDALTLDGSGRAVAVGYRAVAGGARPDVFIAAARLTTAGALDTTFAGTGSFFKQLQGGSVEQGAATAVQSSNKVIVAGTTTTNTSTDFAVIRYNTDGTLDTGFDGDGKALGDDGGKNDTGRAVAIQSDDKIVVAGDGFNVTPGSTTMTVMRFGKDGGLDSTFSGDGIAAVQFGSVNNSNEAHGVAIQPFDGKIVAAGATSESAADWNFAIARFNSNGALDTSFNSTGKLVINLSSGRVDEANAVLIQPDHKILVGGFVYVDANHQQLALVRLNENGSFDTSFGGGTGKVITTFGGGGFPRNEIRGLALLPDGKIIAGGKCNDGTNNANNLICAVRYNTDGSLDNTFGTNGIAATNIESDRLDEGFAVGVQRDEKVVVFGESLKLFVTNDDFALVRYNWDDGSLDSTFGPSNTGVTLTAVSSSLDQANGGAVLSDGTLIAGGTATGSDLGAARYHGDPAAIAAGTPDLADSSDTGLFNNDNITRITTPAFTGTCNPGETTILKVNGATSTPLTRQLCRTGAYTLTSLPLTPDGVYSISVFSRNGHNDTTDSSAITVTIDTFAAAPTITSPTNGEDLEYPPSPSISGNGAEPGAGVQVTEGGNPVCTGAADAGGNWTCASSLGAGSHTIIAKQTDIAGNLSASSAAVTFTLTQRADLETTKTDSQNTAIPGVATSYTITVTNHGPSAAPGSHIADTFSATLTGASWTCAGSSGATCTSSGSGNINDTVNIPVNGVVTYTVNATIDPSATGTLSNTASAATGTGIVDPVPGNNSATDNTTLTPRADVALTKSDSADPVDAASAFSYTLAVTNNGPSTATSMSVTDTLPGGLVFVTAGGTGWTCNQAAGTVTCTRATLLPGDAPAITINVIAPAEGGTLTNTANASSAETDPVPGNNAGSQTTAITPVADLAIVKTDSADPVDATAAFSYTLAVTNNGPSTANAVHVTDTLPSSVGFVSFSTTGWSCNQSSGVINCTLATLAPGAAPDIQINVTAPSEGGFITNQADVTATEIDRVTANNNASEDTTIRSIADLSITKTDGVTGAVPGGSVVYTITVSNPGPSTATGASVGDTFPAILTATWTCTGSGGGTCIASGAGNILDSVDLPPNSSVTYTVTATIDPSATGSLSNTATVSAPSNVNDPDPGNNSATDTDTLQPMADLSITKTDGLTTAIPGQSLTYTIAATNAGLSDAPSSTISDSMPAGLISVTWNCVGSNGGTCTASGSGDINDTVNLPHGASVVYTVHATISGSFFGVLTNTAIVTSSVADPNPVNNSATDTTSVAQAPAITKSFVPAQITLGGISTMTITIDNPNTQAVTGVAVTDNLPAGMIVSTPSNATGDCGGTLTAVAGSGVMDQTGGSIPGGANCTITVDVTATAAGTLTNTTGAVSSTESGPGLTAAAVLTVVAPPDFSKAFAPSQIAVGGISTLTFTITNPSANTIGLTGIGFTDPLPSGISVANPANATDTCGGTLAASSGNTTIGYSEGTLAINSGCTISVDVTASSGGDKVNTTSPIIAAETGAGATATATLNVVAPPTIAKAFSPQAIAPLQISTLTFTLTNPSENTVTLTGVSFNDSFPAGTEVANPPNETNTCGGTFAPLAADTTVSLSGGTIPAGGNCTMTVDVTATTPGVKTNITGNVTSVEGGTGGTATADLTVGKSSQNLAVDPLGRFVIFAGDPGCGHDVLFYQALSPAGQPLGSSQQLTICGLTTGDVSGINLEQDAGNLWISFGGTLPADGKYLMKIGAAGNILASPAPVASATRFGNTAGATAIVLKGCCKIYMYLIGDGGKVYRVVIDKTHLTGKRPKNLGILALSQDSLQITQGNAKRFLSMERPDNTLRGLELDKRGRYDGFSWRLCPSSDGGYELGGVAPDGLAALSNNSDSPIEKLYYQPLTVTGIPVGSPRVVASDPNIVSVDLTNELPGGTRFVVYATETGVFLQVIDATGAKLNAPVPLL